MKFPILILTFLALMAPLLAQKEPDMAEVHKTLRFIRLAETSKKLDLDDQTLLKLNEILDVYEERRLDTRSRERKLVRGIKTTNDDARNIALLDEYQNIREDQLTNEVAMIKSVRALLNPAEAVQFFQFYEQFQQEIHRRINSLQRGRPNKRRQGFKGGN